MLRWTLATATLCVLGDTRASTLQVKWDRSTLSQGKQLHQAPTMGGAPRHGTCFRGGPGPSAGTCTPARPLPHAACSPEAGAGQWLGPRAGHMWPVRRAPGASWSLAFICGLGNPKTPPRGRERGLPELPKGGPRTGAEGGAGARRPGSHAAPPPPPTGSGMVKSIPPWPHASYLRIWGTTSQTDGVEINSQKGLGEDGCGQSLGSELMENPLGVQVTQGGTDLVWGGPLWKAPAPPHCLRACAGQRPAGGARGSCRGGTGLQVPPPSRAPLPRTHSGQSLVPHGRLVLGGWGRQVG